MLKRLKQFRLPMYYKIMLSFMGLLIALSVILSGSSWWAQKNALSLMKERMADRFEVIVEEVSETMEEEGWAILDKDFEVHMDNFARIYDVRFEVFSLDGQEVYSNLKVYEATENDGRQDFGRFMPEYFEEQIPIEVYDETVGYIHVRYFDPKLMNSADVKFLGAISDVFRYAILATMVITLIASFFLARSITKPLNRVGATASEISNGNLKARTNVKSTTREIAELSDAINHMAITLEQEDRLRKQVTSDMAHEIRTPMTSLRNFFEAFIDGVYEPNTDNLTKCHGEILRMSDLVDRLKDLANIEEANLTSKPEKLDLGTELVAMCDLLMPEFDKKDMTLTCDVEESMSLTIDRNHLRQIISNLLTNANRYTDDGGQVKVTGRQGKDGVWFSVGDNGLGMSEEDRHNIFERFYRADKSRDRATGGMGVGLTIVKTLVETYGGSIEVRSELGMGSTFKVTLPKV